MERAVELAANTKGMCFIRSSRAATPVIYENNTQFTVGKAHVSGPFLLPVLLLITFYTQLFSFVCDLMLFHFLGVGITGTVFYQAEKKSAVVCH